MGQSPSGVQGRAPGQGSGDEAESLSAFQRPMKAAKFTPLSVSGKLNVYDVSTTLITKYSLSCFNPPVPPEDWRIKAAEGDGPPGDGFRRE